MFLNQGTSQPEASQEEKVSGDIDMAWACGEFVELDDVQLATVVGGFGLQVGGGWRGPVSLTGGATVTGGTVTGTGTVTGPVSLTGGATVTGGTVTGTGTVTGPVSLTGGATY